MGCAATVPGSGSVADGRHPARCPFCSASVLGILAVSQLVTSFDSRIDIAPCRHPVPAAAGLPAGTELIGSKVVTVAKPAPPAAESFHPATGPILPSRLRIPSIGVDAPVVGVGLLSDGSMDVPDNLWTSAWLSSGARPGEPGRR